MFCGFLKHLAEGLFPGSSLLPGMPHWSIPSNIKMWLSPFHSDHYLGALHMRATRIPRTSASRKQQQGSLDESQGKKCLTEIQFECGAGRAKSSPCEFAWAQ